MGKKLFKYQVDARTGLKNGIDKLANAVGITLGPKGRNVIIQKTYGPPIITNDGVTIAKQVQLQDYFENVGARLCRQAAEKTHDNVGDGTTTATILTQAIVNQGLKSLMAGINPIFLKRRLQKHLATIVDTIKKYSVEIGDQREIEHIATVSANNDSTIGSLIAEAMKTVGKNGIINVEQNKSMETQLVKVDGLQFERGYLSPYFINNQQKLTVQMDDAYILICDKKISAAKDILQVLQQVSKIQRPLLIIADDVQGQALALMIVNKMRGTINVAAVKSPMFGVKKKAMLQDIAIFTGGEYISEDTGQSVQTVKLESLGVAKKIIIDKDSTIIRQGCGNDEDIANRIQRIKTQLKDSNNDYQKEGYKERLAKLTNGIAVIKVGATTESELMQKKARLDDALHATRAAIEQGIVPGGGRVFIKAIGELAQDQNSTKEDRLAIEILKKALQTPLLRIAHNAGDPGQIIVEKLKIEQNINVGYNALTGNIENLLESGIIDPAKVVRNAIQNAVSIASLVLTTGCVLVEQKQEQLSTGGQQMY